jgi:hypothetical protein
LQSLLLCPRIPRATRTRRTPCTFPEVHCCHACLPRELDLYCCPLLMRHTHALSPPLCAIRPVASNASTHTMSLVLLDAHVLVGLLVRLRERRLVRARRVAKRKVAAARGGAPRGDGAAADALAVAQARLRPLREDLVVGGGLRAAGVVAGGGLRVRRVHAPRRRRRVPLAVAVLGCVVARLAGAVRKRVAVVRRAVRVARDGDVAGVARLG